MDVFISVRGFPLESCMESTNESTLTSSFSIRIPLVSFACLITLTQTILNRMQESEQPCLFPNFSKNALFSPV